MGRNKLTSIHNVKTWEKLKSIMIKKVTKPCYMVDGHLKLDSRNCVGYNVSHHKPKPTVCFELPIPAIVFEVLFAIMNRSQGFVLRFH